MLTSDALGGAPLEASIILLTRTTPEHASDTFRIGLKMQLLQGCFLVAPSTLSAVAGGGKLMKTELRLCTCTEL